MSGINSLIGKVSFFGYFKSFELINGQGKKTTKCVRHSVHTNSVCVYCFKLGIAVSVNYVQSDWVEKFCFLRKMYLTFLAVVGGMLF